MKKILQERKERLKRPLLNFKRSKKRQQLLKQLELLQNKKQKLLLRLRELDWRKKKKSVRD